MVSNFHVYFSDIVGILGKNTVGRETPKVTVLIAERYGE